MKKVIVVTLLSLFLIGCTVQTEPQAAQKQVAQTHPPTAAQPIQEEQGKYVNSAAARLVKFVNFANADCFKLQENSFSVGGGWLKRGNEWMSLYTIQLTGGKDYRIIAVGDMDAKDVGVQVLDSNGRTVASDNTISPESVVTFRPKATGRYTVRIRLRDSKGNDPCMCLSILLSR